MNTDTIKKTFGAIADAPRWLRWRLRDERKPPCGPEGQLPFDGWKTKLVTLAVACSQVQGILPPIPGAGHPIAGIGLADATGIDCDNAILPDGTVDPRAQVVLDMVPGYAERSPSGQGFKIFCKVEPPRWLEINFGDGNGIPKPTTKTPNYFAVTGNVLRDGDPSTDGTEALAKIEAMYSPAPAGAQTAPQKPEPLAEVVPSGSQEQAMFREASRLRRLGWKETEIATALWGLVQSGRFPNEPGREPWTFADCQGKAASVCRYTAGESDDFARDGHGVPKKTNENIRLAFAKLGCEFTHDVFADKRFVTRDGEAREFADDILLGLWDEMATKLNLRPGTDMVFNIASVIANEHPVHPVRDYLDSLKWDGTPRVERWLTTYFGADDTPYTRAVGRLFLTAAVRRVRQPGCKFDELPILESDQGRGKSEGFAALCPKSEWFSDSVPLGADAKQVIEATRGVWLVEIAELHGRGKREVDHIKANLSRQVDGPVRLAYARIPVSVPRQFVQIGTTNSDAYLQDTTGNRRFWPVETGDVDAAGLRRDRNEIWAEAAAIEASGASIRLDPSLWKEAGAEQEAREIAEPWVEVLERAIGERNGIIRTEDCYRILQLPVERRDQQSAERLAKALQKLGFKPTRRRVGGERRRGLYHRGGTWEVEQLDLGIGPRDAECGL